MLDETLSFGCLGETGRGLTELQSIPPTQAGPRVLRIDHRDVSTLAGGCDHGLARACCRRGRRGPVSRGGPLMMCCSAGGFCAGRRGLVDHQRPKGRSRGHQGRRRALCRLAGAGYCFSASCPPWLGAIVFCEAEAKIIQAVVPPSTLP